MPKLIDYPRTSYTGAWEVAEVVDDTGGKCALETCARKLNRKVSGSFKAIVGSAVKFGLLTSKREVLATTTLFRRIKHAYDKQEELVFHREAFLTPPLFTQLCRKFRSRELPVAMLDVLLIREFGVEEINAQPVAKAFIDGARMVNLLDENNAIADIDQLATQQAPRRELASPTPPSNVFRQLPQPAATAGTQDEENKEDDEAAPDPSETPTPAALPQPSSAPSGMAPLEKLRHAAEYIPSRSAPAATSDAIASLFGLENPVARTAGNPTSPGQAQVPVPATATVEPTPDKAFSESTPQPESSPQPAIPMTKIFRIQLTGPGINTQLDVTDPEDLGLVRALLDKIERQLKK
ncbi:MAG: hypothetical protein EOO56_10765 [Hymenobacter sp.]|nr:MAG: hypothetical protein EOO56_10765 [Hymenobacter sp.]